VVFKTAKEVIKAMEVAQQGLPIVETYLFEEDYLEPDYAKIWRVNNSDAPIRVA